MKKQSDCRCWKSKDNTCVVDGCRCDFDYAVIGNREKIHCRNINKQKIKHKIKHNVSVKVCKSV